MYKCRNMTNCIHPNQLCDGQYDCPLFDDEDFCEACPPGCECLGYSYDCHGIGHDIFKSNLARVNQLRMTQHRLQNLTYTLRNSKIVYWNLANGELRFIKPRIFEYVNNLERINLQNNRITFIHADTFLGLHRLINLALQGNQLTITSGSFKGLSSLRALDLANSNITNVNSTYFQGLDNLVTLSLSNCNIHTIEDDAVRHLVNLRMLNITMNPLSLQANQNLTLSKQLEKLYTPNAIFCCIADLKEGDCTPPGDAFSSCTNLIRHVPQKYFTLIISVAGILFNSYKMIEIMSTMTNNKKPLTYQCLWNTNLYMVNTLYSTCFLLIMMADIKFSGSFYRERESWIRSPSCFIIKIASSAAYQITIFLLCACLCLTLIKRKIGISNVSLDFWSRALTSGSWIVGLVIAALLVHVPSGHSGDESAICLKHVTLNKPHGVPAMIVIFLNFLFILVCFIYCLTYTRMSKFLRILFKSKFYKKNSNEMVKEFIVKLAFPVALPWLLVETVGEYRLQNFV